MTLSGPCTQFLSLQDEHGAALAEYSYYPEQELLQVRWHGHLNGAVVIETVFGWPGIGLLLIQAIERRDLPLIEACVFAIAVMIIFANLLVDLAYTFFDPRIRYT